MQANFIGNSIEHSTLSANFFVNDFDCKSPRVCAKKGFIDAGECAFSQMLSNVKI